MSLLLDLRRIINKKSWCGHVVSYDRSQYRDTRYQSWHQRWHLGYPEPGEAIQKKQDWTFRCRVLRDPSWYFAHYTEGRPSPWILTSNYTKTTGTLPPNTWNSPRYLRHPFWIPGLVTQSNPCRQQPLDLRPLGHRSVAMSHPRQGGRMFGVSLGLMNGFQLV